MTFTCQNNTNYWIGIVHRNSRISKLIVPMRNARKDGLLEQAHFSSDNRQVQISVCHWVYHYVYRDIVGSHNPDQQQHILRGLCTDTSRVTVWSVYIFNSGTCAGVRHSPFMLLRRKWGSHMYSICFQKHEPIIDGAVYTKVKQRYALEWKCNDNFTYKNKRE